MDKRHIKDENKRLYKKCLIVSGMKKEDITHAKKILFNYLKAKRYNKEKLPISDEKAIEVICFGMGCNKSMGERYFKNIFPSCSTSFSEVSLHLRAN